MRKMGLIVVLERVPWPESVDHSMVPGRGTSPPVFLVFTLIVVAGLSLTFSNEVGLEMISCSLWLLLSD